MGILALLETGATNKEIGVALGLTEGVIKQYTMGLRVKYQCKNRTDLAVHFATGTLLKENTNA
jgi:DNA-binding CsgD family transcriptional regulator